MGHSSHSIRLLMAALAFVSAVAEFPTNAQGGAGGQSRTSSPSAAFCPLTDAQTAKSIDAFAKIANFLTTEPRCVGCHGGVNPFIKDTGLDPGDEPDSPTPASRVVHGGGLIVRQRETTPDGVRLMEGECMDCHNNMVPKADGSPSTWTLAPNFLSFVDKDATTLCRQIKRATGNADHFLGHLENDNGGNAFALTAFKGNRGLDPDRYPLIVPKVPKISHETMMQMGRDWVAAMGGSFKGDEGCGCEFRHAKWSGRVEYTVDMASPELHDDQVTSSGRRFSQTIYTFTDGVGTATASASVTSHSEMRRGVVDNGARSFIKDTSYDNNGSGGRTFPATVEVTIRENGEYSIDPGITGSQEIGTSTSIACRYNRDGGAQCDTQTLPLYPEQWIAGDLSGVSSDPNHVQGSKTKQDAVGSGSSQGVNIRTLTWDLWRSN
jgi:hypothetical protein